MVGGNKFLGELCGDIVRLISGNKCRDLVLALTATLWNLSALEANRNIIAQDCDGLSVLAELLASGDVGLQKEAAGCIRNITLNGIGVVLAANFSFL